MGNVLGCSRRQTRNCIWKYERSEKTFPQDKLSQASSPVLRFGERAIPPGRGLEVTKNQTSHLYDPKGSSQAPS